MQNGSDSATPQAHRPDARRQPRGLYVLCATVGFERFSFFLFSAILVLYLNERIGLPGARAVAIYGSFLCGSYLTPLLGGRLCDGRLGCRRTALLGCALVGAGCSNIVPVLYTAVGKQTVMPEHIAVPAITTLGYAGILAGPAVIGFIAHGSSLSTAFILIAVLLAAVAISGKVLKV